MYRWIDSEQTTFQAEDGGPFFPAERLSHPDFAGATIAPFRPWANLAAAKAALIADVEAIAQRLRVRVASTNDATKLAVYREKYAVAVAALGGDGAALAKLAPEAAARGQSASSLATLVKSLGDAWTQAGLAIDAAYQAHKAAIAPLADLDAAEAYSIETGWP